MEEKFKSEEQLYEYLKTQREKEVDRHKRNLKSQLEKVLKIILKPFYSKEDIENKVTNLISKYDLLYSRYQDERRVISQVWSECTSLMKKALLPPSSAPSSPKDNPSMIKDETNLNT